MSLALSILLGLAAVILVIFQGLKTITVVELAHQAAITSAKLKALEDVEPKTDDELRQFWEAKGEFKSAVVRFSIESFILQLVFFAELAVVIVLAIRVVVAQDNLNAREKSRGQGAGGAVESSSSMMPR